MVCTTDFAPSRCVAHAGAFQCPGILQNAHKISLDQISGRKSLNPSICKKQLKTSKTVNWLFFLFRAEA